MKRVICDNPACKKEVPPDQYGLAPIGWVGVSVKGDVLAWGLDYCSKACAVKGLGGTMPEDQPTASDSELPVVRPGA